MKRHLFLIIASTFLFTGAAWAPNNFSLQDSSLLKYRLNNFPENFKLSHQTNQLKSQFKNAFEVELLGLMQIARSA